MTKTPEPVSEFVPGIDAAVEAAVARAIEKDPARRYQTLAEMIVDLANVKARVGVKLASQESVTFLGLPPGVAPRTPRPFTDRDLISKRRAERIDAYLEEAQRAFDAGEFGTAVESCDQAMLLDPDDVRVHSLLERARRALDHQQAVDLIADARTHLERTISKTLRRSSIRRRSSIQRSPTRESSRARSTSAFDSAMRSAGSKNWRSTRRRRRSSSKNRCSPPATGTKHWARWSATRHAST
jgi:hypothetical protein